MDHFGVIVGRARRGPFYSIERVVPDARLSHIGRVSHRDKVKRVLMGKVDDVLIGTDAVKAGQLKTGHMSIRYLEPQQRQLAPIIGREAGDLQVIVRKSLVD